MFQTILQTFEVIRGYKIIKIRPQDRNLSGPEAVFSKRPPAEGHQPNVARFLGKFSILLPFIALYDMFRFDLFKIKNSEVSTPFFFIKLYDGFKKKFVVKEA